jgi:hypothetical protein
MKGFNLIPGFPVFSNCLFQCGKCGYSERLTTLSFRLRATCGGGNSEIGDTLTTGKINMRLNGMAVRKAQQRIDTTMRMADALTK